GDKAQARARRIVISALVIAEINRRKDEGKKPDDSPSVRAEIEALFPGTAVLHAPDQIAGGEFDKFAIDVNQYADKRKLRTGEIVLMEAEARRVLGNLNINSSIGS